MTHQATFNGTPLLDWEVVNIVFDEPCRTWLTDASMYDVLGAGVSIATADLEIWPDDGNEDMERIDGLNREQLVAIVGEKRIRDIETDADRDWNL